MTVKLDRSLQMPPIALAILLIGFLVIVANGIGQFFVLTALQTSIVGFVAFVFTALATLLTTVETQP
jgi:uncharacterized membrane protein YoaT (DUF817 family)